MPLFWHTACTIIIVSKRLTEKQTSFTNSKLTIMKKVLVAIALVMGLGSSVAFAQNVENANAVVTTAQAPQDEYTKIEVKDLPAAVTEALGKAYPESTIKEASVTAKEDGKLYKVVVTQKDGKETTVVMNEKGEEVK